MFGRETMLRAKDGDDNSEGCVTLVSFPSPTPVERKLTSVTHMSNVVEPSFAHKLHRLSDQTLEMTWGETEYTQAKGKKTR